MAKQLNNDFDLDSDINYSFLGQKQDSVNKHHHDRKSNEKTSSQISNNNKGESNQKKYSKLKKENRVMS